MENIEEKYPLVGKTGARYYEGEYKGEPARFYESGAIMNIKTGQMMKGLITSETAADLQKMGVEARYKNREEGFIEAFQEDGFTVEDINIADKLATKVLTREVLLSAEATSSARVMAYEKLLKAMGRWGDIKSEGIKFTQGDRSIEVDSVNTLVKLKSVLEEIIE